MTQANEPDLFEVDEPTILIFVGTSIGSDLSTISPNDVYASVRGWWTGKTEPREADGELILARNSTRVVGVFRARQWVRSPFDNPPRWGFSGEPAELSAQLRYFGKGIPPEYKTQNPVRYLLWE